MANNTNGEQLKTFDIPDYNMPVVEAKIAKLNKRAARIGAEPIQIVVGEKWVKKIYWSEEESMLNAGNVKYEIDMTKIQVIGSAPKLNGWTLVSVVEPVEEGNLLRKFPGVELELPQEFRDVTPDRCDHCHVSRQRNETFVVHHDGGDWKVVGRTCLRDFTGHQSPEAIANYASALHDILLSLHDDERIHDGGSYGHGYYEAPMRSFLKMVAIISGREGFITSTQARKREEAGDYVTPTGQAVFRQFFHPNSCMKGADYKKFSDSITDEEDVKADDLVDAAMQWGKTQFVDEAEEKLSDYGHNMKLLLAANRVRIIDVGYVASVISGYKRSIQPRNGQLTGRGHVGTVSEKITVPVTVVRVSEYAGNYGLIYIHNMKTDDGDLITWFAPAKKGKMTEGEHKVMVATVKRHDERMGVKSTVVTYPKFI